MSGGCARCFGTSSRPSAWPWQLLSTTVLVRRKRWRCSRTAPHGDRRPPPGPGRRWSTRRTTAHGHRRLHLRGCGRAVSLSPGRRGVTAACGAPQGKLLSWVCHRWRTLRLKPSMVAPSDTSSRRTLCGRSLRRRRKRRRGTRRGLRRRRGGRRLSWITLPLFQRGRGRKGGRGGRLVPPLFLAALVVDTDSGSLASAGFTGDDVPRVMFPSVDARPKMLCFMAGMYQEDSYAVFAGDDAPRAVLSRFHRCSSWTIYWPVVCNDRFSGPGAVLGQVLTCPLLCLTGEVGPDSTKNRGIAADAVLRRWLTSLLHAATSSCSSRAREQQVRTVQTVHFPRRSPRCCS